MSAGGPPGPALAGRGGRTTRTAYDGLGRLTGVWKPGNKPEANPDQPDVAYAYLLRGDAGAAAVTTKKLNQDGNFVTGYALYDGLMRSRQTQQADAAGGPNAVI